MGSTNLYLPPEVHRILARYINSQDIPNYRLLNKCCAEIGAEELFQTITFHCSGASIARVKAIKGNEHLRKQVKVAFWDANYWRIPYVQGLPSWQDYFKEKSDSLRPWGSPEFETCHGAKLGQLAKNQQEWEAYVDKAKDEDQNRRIEVLHAALLGFENLRTILVLNGDLSQAHRGLEKWGDIVEYSANDEPVLLRGEGLHMDGPYIPDIYRPGAEALETLRMLPGLCLSKLSIDALCYTAFEEPINVAGTLDTLTSFHFRLTDRADGWNEYHEHFTTDNFSQMAQDVLSHGHLAEFLTRLVNLESLEVDLGEFCSDYREDSAIDSTADVIFPQDFTWPKLRMLSLRNFDSTPKRLLALLERHSSTLKDLRFHHLHLELDTSVVGQEWGWRDVLQIICETLHLERATLSGWLSLTPERGEWFLDNGLAAPVATYLVEGGECPLNTGNAGRAGIR
ncbi:hypothetical protein BKA66DRAFT_608839 [Pyrenochaeta sp. MPI-SDFR-AT-0127]|nr:hypothetical protein BKA66DRAFT_608839 [Pyrenochaeta sp. MPI-SDFR-AT-0127]